MKGDSLILLDWEFAAIQLASRDPHAAIERLLKYRRRLWRQQWWAEARDVALSALSIADISAQLETAVHLARWTAKRFPSADYYLILGEALFKCGRDRSARAACQRAAILADESGALFLAETARALVARRPVAETTLALQQVRPNAYKLAQSDPRAAIQLLERHTRTLLRSNARRDANDALRLCVILCVQAAQTRLGKRLGERLVAEVPCAESVRLLAEVELKSGRGREARALALRARRLAKKEGSLKESRLATCVAEEATRILQGIEH